MKINIITNYNSFGLANEAQILTKLLTRQFKNRIEIRHIRQFEYKAPFADINILLEVLPNILINYARMNILIPNQQVFHSAWFDYLHRIDLVLTKTHYATKLFKDLSNRLELTKLRITYLGFTSIDRFQDSTQSEKDFKKYLHLAGSSKFKGTQSIIDSWKPEYPSLTVSYSKQKIPDLHEKQQANITYISEFQQPADLVNIMNSHGIHICCSTAEGFGHYINEARSTGAIVITTNGEPMKSFVDHEETGYLVNVKSSGLIADALGKYFTIDSSDFQNIIEHTMTQPEKKLNQMSKAARKAYSADKIKFKDNFETIMMAEFRRYTEIHQTSLTDHLEEIRQLKISLIGEGKLPSVSIITLTYNRAHFFPLAIRNWESTLYPKNKLEWIIVDNSSEGQNLSDIPISSNVKYIRDSEKHTIAENRNIGCSAASGDVIVFMDDDDYYPPNSVKQRVLELVINTNSNSGISCVFCSTIGCYHIKKNTSIINQPPLTIPQYERISEATLCFYKTFWESHNFVASTGEEGRAFVKHRLQQCREISCDGVIVSLLHEKNTSTRRLPELPEPNGNHFGWDDELFQFITGLCD